MKRIVIALLLVLIASTAVAQVPTTLFDLNNNVVAENTVVSVQNVVVTATRYNGFFVTEGANGPYQGMWVYTDVEAAFVAGDVLNIIGEFYRYYDVAEIDVTDPANSLIGIVGSGPAPVPTVVPAVELIGSTAFDPWVSSLITIPDMGTVVEFLSYGEWNVDYGVGIYKMDDYWYDETTLVLGDCFRSVTGINFFAFGSARINPFVDGIEFCPVPTDEQTFGSMKAMYR